MSTFVASATGRYTNGSATKRVTAGDVVALDTALRFGLPNADRAAISEIVDGDSSAWESPEWLYLPSTLVGNAVGVIRDGSDFIRVLEGDAGASGYVTLPRTHSGTLVIEATAGFRLRTAEPARIAINHVVGASAYAAIAEGTRLAMAKYGSGWIVADVTGSPDLPDLVTVTVP